MLQFVEMEIVVVDLMVDFEEVVVDVVVVDFEMDFAVVVALMTRMKNDKIKKRFENE